MLCHMSTFVCCLIRQVSFMPSLPGLNAPGFLLFFFEFGFMSDINFYVLVEPENKEQAADILSKCGDFEAHGVDDARGLFEFGVFHVELDGGDGHKGAEALKEAGIPFSAYWTRPEHEHSGHGEIHYRVSEDGVEKYIELGGVDDENIPGVILTDQLSVDYDMLVEAAADDRSLASFIAELNKKLAISDFSNGSSIKAGELACSVFYD